MSLGVNLLAALVKRVARTLGEDFDIEVLEMHHRMKVDAPSGTALLLGEAAAAGRGVALAEHSVRVPRRPHRRAPRAATSALRRCAAARWSATTASSSPAPANASTLSHHAEDRGIFARGAVQRGALGQAASKPGLYDMNDVLGLGDI